jgi:L-galactonate 5-dehydrogenase
MNAVVITSPGVIGLEERPDPVPGSGEILVRVVRAGYCGSDLTSFRGLNPMVAYPRTPGHELSGTVAAVGDAVPAVWAPGTEVLILPYTSCGKCSACRQGRENCCRHNQTLGVQREGGMCEWICVPWQKLMKAPGLNFAEMALVEPLTVGFHAASRGRIQPGDTVVVVGCGAIGLGAIAGASFRGGLVVAVDLDDGKLDLARKAGASEIIHSGREDLHDRLLSLTDGEGPEVVIEAVGTAATFRLAVEEVCFAGRVVYIGYAKAPVEYETKFFVQKELDIMGSRNATPEDFRNVVGMLRAKRFPVAEVITRAVSLVDAPEAMREWSRDPLSVTKIQVVIGE